MPRKIKAERSLWLRRTARPRSQWPVSTNWGTGRFSELAVERWLARHQCAARGRGCRDCESLIRVSGLREAYRAKKSRW